MRWVRPVLAAAIFIGPVSRSPAAEPYLQPAIGWQRSAPVALLVWPIRLPGADPLLRRIGKLAAHP